ncbi:MAG TPA: M1 family aminopeptidase [Candidatus Cloacimonadota bacterium]|nr:M1 family aminopeptidase [Candidatus Cloacimonadota bacterium]
MKHNRYLVLVCLLFCLGSLFADRVWDASASRKYNYPMQKVPHFDAKADSATGFDVQKYEINVNITQSPNHINGEVKATVLAETNLSSISYELEGLTVSQVWVNGAAATFTHSNGVLTIPVLADAGEIFQTRVAYGGQPQLSGPPYNVGMYFQTNSIFTISDPDAGRYWWPCYDHPWDKAIVDITVTMRSDWKVAANGLRESITDNGNGTATTIWRGENPMTTYLVCITAGPYVEIAQTALDGELPILNFVTQAQYSNALSDLANLPSMIDYYSSLFGEYPFEKYGNATVNMSTFGAMEHQTMTTLGNYIINGNGTHEITIAHELAHQWFGNAVSFLDFSDVWLSEGFATFSEHLWVDYVDGWQAACNYVDTSYHQYYMNWESSYNPPAIYNPGFADYFSPPSYEKAASVLHMLRLKMGDAQFFQLLQQWFNTYKNGNVVTSEFQAMAETISGLDLEQFFQQWIYGRGIPSVSFRLMHNPVTNALKVYSTSTSPTSTSFDVDFPIRLGSGAAADSVLVMASPEGYLNHFDSIESIDAVSPNHNHWTILRGITEDRPQILSAIGADAAVTLRWAAFAGAHSYRLYYRLAGSDPWIQSELVVEPNTSALLTGLINGEEYQFVIKGVDVEGYQSRASDPISATPNDLSLIYPLLVVDETRDGNGGNISPSDAMVDDFYAAALTPIEFDTWDVASQGLPTINDLGQYVCVIWHADDFSQNMVNEAESMLLNYVFGGGRLIFSGWRSATVLSKSFWQNIFDDLPYTVHYDNAACLSGLNGDGYPELIVDQDKLATPWNGLLPMINTFEVDLPALYYAQMPPTFEGNGLKAAIEIREDSYFFGFPLYYMEAPGVQALLQTLISKGTGSEDAISPIPCLALSAHPNPFNPSTRITFANQDAGKVQLKLYNAKGQLLEMLADGVFAKGNHSLTLNLDRYSSGVYILRLESGGRSVSKRVTLMK